MTGLSTDAFGFNIVPFAKTAVRKVVSALAGGNSLATTTAPDELDIDGLMRAAYLNALPTLFGGVKESASGRPISTPDFSVRNVIGKFRKNMFPKDTVWRINDDKDGKQWQAVQAVLDTMRWKQKLNYIVEEAALLGYCGVRTVYDDENKQWHMDIIRKEQLEIQKDPDHRSEILSVAVTWQTTNEKGEVLAHKEQWTKDFCFTWPPIKIGGLLGAPKFQEKDKQSEPNNYKEIPITIVPHRYDPWAIGRGALRHDDILAVQTLIELRDKRKRAHLQWMKPPLVRKNHDSIGEPVCLDPDTVIDIRTGEGEHEADLFLLESQGVPESAIVEIKEWVDFIYDNAGLTPPSQIENFAAGGVVKSGVALDILTEEEEETINDLRDDGYTEVSRHVEKIIRMGLALGGNAATPFMGIKATATPQGGFISLVFPSLTTPSDAEISETLQVLSDSHLSTEEKAKREAQIFGITDETEIQEIQANWEESKKLTLPTAPPPNGFAGV